MRILVTGGRGQLGRELSVRGPERGHDIVLTDLPDVDLTDAAAVDALIASQAWDAVINCAAYTAVDKAEADEATAHAVNAVAPGNVARACAANSVALVHISTDFVFDGTATSPIPEDATPNPISAYGRTKLAGEEAVRAAGGEHAIVRTSWLFGQDGPNFVLTMLRLGAERDSLSVVADQKGSPTWTGHLGPALLRLMELRGRGMFHLTNSGETTWHGLAAYALEVAGLSTPVREIGTADYPTPARRPAYSVLGNAAWLALGEPPLPDWHAAVDEYVRARVAV